MIVGLTSPERVISTTSMVSLILPTRRPGVSAIGHELTNDLQPFDGNGADTGLEDRAAGWDPTTCECSLYSQHVGGLGIRLGIASGAYSGVRTGTSDLVHGVDNRVGRTVVNVVCCTQTEAIVALVTAINGDNPCTFDLGVLH